MPATVCTIGGQLGARGIDEAEGREEGKVYRCCGARAAHGSGLVVHDDKESD